MLIARIPNSNPAWPQGPVWNGIRSFELLQAWSGRLKFRAETAGILARSIILFVSFCLEASDRLWKGTYENEVEALSSPQSRWRATGPSSRFLRAYPNAVRMGGQRKRNR
jgi:hypothetical protein